MILTLLISKSAKTFLECLDWQYFKMLITVRTRKSEYLRCDLLELINTFSSNVPSIDKPGRWFLLAKCLKNTCAGR